MGLRQCGSQVERQLDLSSVAARLRGLLVRESRRIHVPLVVPVSTVVESGPRHQQSKALTCGALGVVVGVVKLRLSDLAPAVLEPTNLPLTHQLGSSLLLYDH
ncbi:hypothetical protein Taro_050425, partial [Colocasia esculenta]|nr:hypothetical protein [Colocasia esculenta]